MQCTRPASLYIQNQSRTPKNYLQQQTPKMQHGRTSVDQGQTSTEGSCSGIHDMHAKFWIKNTMNLDKALAEQLAAGDRCIFL